MEISVLTRQLVLWHRRKFDRGLTQLTHAELHWLNVLEWFKHKLDVITRRSLNGIAPQYGIWQWQLSLHSAVFQSLRLPQGSSYVPLPVISW